MRGTAIAHSNIAFIKYWGKRDEKKILPTGSSLSMTLDQLYTTTTVSFDCSLSKDLFFLNREEAGEKDRLKVSRFLDQVRSLTKTSSHAMVTSVNSVPTGAGLASSASGYAALAAASIRALDCSVDEPALSRLARHGSGSACRSIYGGFVEWQKGKRTDGIDSYGRPVAPSNHWDLVMMVASVSTDQKAISSREGMKRSVETSPYYQAWLDTAERDLMVAKRAILERDFETLGQVTEANALNMHAVTLGAEPPILYWQDGTLSVMHTVRELRRSGIPAYFTVDAGPNVIILCEPPNVPAIREAVLQIRSVNDVMVCHPGPGVVYPGEEEAV